ncbi:MAG: flagellar motor switch protein FliG [Gammaproteobacteria bacterium]|nr:flagellar motor switch protein FliG [Gammaproteobacteria bacterium]
MTEAAAGSGIERAAILLMSLGEETAAAILRHMNVDEVQQIGSAMATVSDVPRDHVSNVLGELLSEVGNKTSLGMNSGEYLRKVLTESLGERKATSLLDRIVQQRDSKGIDALRWMDPRIAAEVIKDEHPQIIATILAHLTGKQAAEVLDRFETELQVAVTVRLARLEEISETALQELDNIVDQQTRQTIELRTARMGGIRFAADMVGRLPSGAETALLEAIKEADESLGDQIQDALLVFENLLKVDDRGMQTILREVQSDTLMKALKGADQEIRDKIFKNMSKRAAELLRDDLAVSGPIKLSDVEEAQKEILIVAMRLAEEGQIMLGSGSDDFV